MTLTQKVALQGIRFFAYHGFYPEEQLIGNEFIVDICAEFEVLSNGDDELQNTVNYERLFEIASSEMKQTRKLLETVAHGILNRVKDEFTFVHMVQVGIRKLHLPVTAEVNNSLVEVTFKR